MVPNINIRQIGGFGAFRKDPNPSTFLKHTFDFRFSFCELFLKHLRFNKKENNKRIMHNTQTVKNPDG